jgi:hypothetical protein
METKELRLVTHEQAVRLKKLGFNWATGNVYYDEIEEKWISAPAVALALQWLRDEKEIRCGIDVRASFEGGRINIFYCGKFAQYGNYGLEWAETNRKDSYPKAESALLDELLTVLEKEKEQ